MTGFTFAVVHSPLPLAMLCETNEEDRGMAKISRLYAQWPKRTLTLLAVRESGWGAVLHQPFPKRPSRKLIEEARKELLIYFDWVSSYGFLHCSEADDTADVRRAAEKLVELGKAWRAIEFAELVRA